MQRAAFELSLCFTLGFGVDKDDIKACALLEEAGMFSFNLLGEINSARNMTETSIQYGRWSILNKAGRIGHVGTANVYHSGITNETLNVTMARLEKEIADVESVLGDQHQIIGILKSSVVTVAISQRNWDLAGDVETRLLEWSQRTLGYFESFTLNCKMELGWIRSKQLRLDESELLLTQVLAESLLELVLDHGVTMSSVIYLVPILYTQGKWAKAKRLSKQALQIMEIEYGPEHYRTRVLLDMMSRNQQNEAGFDDFVKNILQVRLTIAPDETSIKYQSNPTLAILSFQHEQMEGKSKEKTCRMHSLYQKI